MIAASLFSVVLLAGALGDDAPVADAPRTDLVDPAAAAPAPLEPVAKERDEADVHAALGVRACLDLVAAGKKDEAAACYRDRAALAADASTAADPARGPAQTADADADARLALALADATARLRLGVPQTTDPRNAGAPGAAVVVPAPSSTDADPLALDALVASGKAELVATSTLAGAYGGELLLLAALQSSGVQPGASPGVDALTWIAPVAGGAAALVASSASVVALPRMTPGDAHVVRSFLLLGGFHSIAAPFVVAQLTGGHGPPPGAATPALMLAVLGADALAGVGLAVAVDLPEHGGSLATTGALWSGVGALLAGSMFRAYAGEKGGDAALDATLLASTAGFAAGLAASPVVPLTRADTWAIDVGGGLGLLAGASLAFFARAPNEFLGYGTMLAGTAGGMAIGLGAARTLPPLFDAGLDLIPLAIDDGHERTVGAAVRGRL